MDKNPGMYSSKTLISFQLKEEIGAEILYICWILYIWTIRHVNSLNTLEPANQGLSLGPYP